MSVLPKYNMIESMRVVGVVKFNIERRLAELALGITGALREASISPEDAYYDLFNLDMYQSIKKHRLSREVNRKNKPPDCVITSVELATESAIIAPSRC